MGSFYISTDKLSKSLTKIASVGVVIKEGQFLLMGKRRDSGRWTLPGGHVEGGESLKDGAKRELWEEAGIKTSDLKKIGTKTVTSEEGKRISVTAYLYEAKEKPKTTVKNDPDKEVFKWEWVNVKDGLPKEILENLHSPKNVVLDKMGLQKSLGGIMDEIKKGGQGSGRRPEHEAGGASSITTKDSSFYVSEKRKLRNKLDDEKIKEKEKSSWDKMMKERGIMLSERFVIDIMKGDGHKYIRKYRRAGKWIYIYKDPEGRPKTIDKKAYGIIKKMAELGDKHAKKVIAGGTQAYSEEKLKVLRELADLGDTHAHDHLASIGIDRKGERLEEKLIPGAAEIRLKHQRSLTGEEQKKFDVAVKKGLEKMVDRLWRSNRDYDVSKQARSAVGQDSDTYAQAIEKLMKASEGDSIEERLTNLNKVLIKIDKNQNPDGRNFSSSYGEATNAGGYGNLTWNETIKELQVKTILPNRYVEAVKRNSGQEVRIADPDKVKEEIAKKEREEVERKRIEDERLRRELEERKAGLADSMGYMMVNMMTSPPRGDAAKVEKALKIQETLKRMFGKELKKEDWPYDFSSSGYTVKISELGYGRGGLELSFRVTDRDGRSVVSPWRRRWSGGVNSGAFKIYNAHLEVNTNARGADAPIGSLINKAQVEFIKKHAPNNGVIAVGAALTVGGYNWTNQGFAFESSSTLSNMRRNFKDFVKSAANINLTDSDMSHFKLPCHFSSFHDGKFYTGRGNAPLTKNQKQYGNLEGREGGGTPLTSSEISSKTTKRFHLGKAFLLGKSWSGVFHARDMKPGKEQYDHFMNYSQRKLEAWKDLGVKPVVEAVRAGDRAAPERRTTSSSTPTRGSPPTDRMERIMRVWRPTGRSRNMTINAGRLSSMRAWSRDEFDWFIANAPITPAGKRKVQEVRRVSYGR